MSNQRIRTNEFYTIFTSLKATFCKLNIGSETELERNPLITVIIPPPYYRHTDYSNHLPSVSIGTFATATSEYHYSEYSSEHFADIGAGTNGLNDDAHSEYIVEEKDGITSIEMQINANDGEPTTNVAEINANIRRNEYVCDICGKQLSSKSNLKRHRSIHTGEQRFECWMCHEK